MYKIFLENFSITYYITNLIKKSKYLWIFFKKCCKIYISTKLHGVKGGFFMEITDIKIRKINAEGKMKAIVSVTLDDVFVVHDIKIIEGTDKLFIAMPSRKTPEGEYRDIAHPINAEMRELLQSKIISKYEEVKNSESL